MTARTTEERRLQRLATAYAVAYAELTWIGSRDADEREAIRKQLLKARDRLYAEFRRLTAVDLTPRAVSEGD